MGTLPDGVKYGKRMSKMKKVVITAFGDESKLAIVEVDLPEPDISVDGMARVIGSLRWGPVPVGFHETYFSKIIAISWRSQSSEGAGCDR